MMENKCAGDDPTKKAMPECFTCPSCGNEVEIWTDETRAKCSSCGKVLLREPAQAGRLEPPQRVHPREDG